MLTFCSASIGAAVSALVYHMEWVELEVMVLVEPCADKVIEPEARAP
jgi:hypothetical protein